MTGNNQSAAHSALVNEILMIFGGRKNLTLWKNATGAVKIGARFLRFGMKGSPDILGIADGGRFVGIEVKTGAAKQSPEQKLFQAMVFRRGGLYVLAHCVDDVENALSFLPNDSDWPPPVAS